MVVSKKLLVKIGVFLVFILVANGGCISSVVAYDFSCDNEVEYWGVVVTALPESLGPYVYDGLISSEIWHQDNLCVLYKQNATREKIIDGLNWLATIADENDIVLFSFDGHGSCIGGVYGIWAWDDSAISVEELNGFLDEISYGEMVLIFDCCFAGTFCQESFLGELDEVAIVGDFSVALSSSLTGENREVLMSTMPFGLGSHWIGRNWLTGEKVDLCFSSLLAEGLDKRVDYNNDGACAAEEVFRYARVRLLPRAVFTAFRVIMQVGCYLAYKHWYLPFPTMYDGFSGDIIVC